MHGEKTYFIGELYSKIQNIQKSCIYDHGEKTHFMFYAGYYSVGVVSY